MSDDRPRFWVCERCGAQYSMSISKCLFNACPTNHSEDTLEMVGETKTKPLYRGRSLDIRKLEDWMVSNMKWADFQGTCMRVFIARELIEEINSGRLDVEEG